MSELKLTSLASRNEQCDGCGSCVGRREFLRTGLGAAAVAALAALLPTGAEATPVRWTRASTRGGELRYPLPATDGVDVDRSNELILVRHEGVVTAFALSCPHQRSMLRWREGDGIFQSTKHHSEYGPLGVYQKGRATRNMDRLLIRREGDELVVDPSTKYQSDEDPQGWASAALKVG
jgi:nitrite reductase/ring-hydroxylating ferredoxin subunit